MALVLSLKNTTKEFLITFNTTNMEHEFFSETVSGSFVLFSFLLASETAWCGGHDKNLFLSLKTWICDHRLICG